MRHRNKTPDEPFEFTGTIVWTHPDGRTGTVEFDREINGHFHALIFPDTEGNFQLLNGDHALMSGTRVKGLFVPETPGNRIVKASAI